MSALTLDRVLTRIGWTHQPSRIHGKRDWFDAYGELIGSFDAYEGWQQVRAHLANQADADHDGTSFIPNREMKLLMELDDALYA